MSNENNFLKYNELLTVPAGLTQFLSARLLSEDYWNNIHIDDYAVLEQAAESYFKVKPLTIEEFQFEIKLEDLGEEHPYVPRYHDRQGLIYLWSVDLEKSLDWLPNTISQHVPNGLEFKLERQAVKSSCPNYSEFCMAQIYLEEDYVFVGILKMPNWLSEISVIEKRNYYKNNLKYLQSSNLKNTIQLLLGVYVFYQSLNIQGL